MLFLFDSVYFFLIKFKNNMCAIVVEGDILNYDETREVVAQRFFVENNRFVMKMEEQVIFNSDIFQFQDDSMIYLKRDDTVAGGMIDIVFNYIGIQDYDLIKVANSADVQVTRLDFQKFIVVYKNNAEGYGRIKFCRLNDSKKMEEITLEFTKLCNIHYLENSVIINFYEDIEKDDKIKKVCNIMQFDFDGRQKRVILDLVEDDFISYKTDLNDKFLCIIKKNGRKQKVIKKIKISEL